MIRYIYYNPWTFRPHEANRVFIYIRPVRRKFKPE